RRRHTRFSRDWSSDVCSSDLAATPANDQPCLVKCRLWRLLPARVGLIDGQLIIGHGEAEQGRQERFPRSPGGSIAEPWREQLLEIGRASCREREEMCVGVVTA